MNLNLKIIKSNKQDFRINKVSSLAQRYVANYFMINGYNEISINSVNVSKDKKDFVIIIHNYNRGSKLLYEKHKVQYFEFEVKKLLMQKMKIKVIKSVKIKIIDKYQAIEVEKILETIKNQSKQ